LLTFLGVTQSFALQRLPNAVHFLCDNSDSKKGG
jgi:hypothetical protein